MNKISMENYLAIADFNSKLNSDSFSVNIV